MPFSNPLTPPSLPNSQILSSHHLINAPSNLAHLLALQSPIGGIRKTADDPPDAMHSYLGLAAMALHKGEVHRRAAQREEGKEGEVDKEEGDKREEEQQQLLQLLEGLATQGLDPCLNVSLETRAWIVEKLGRGGEGECEEEEAEGGTRETSSALGR